MMECERCNCGSALDEQSAIVELNTPFGFLARLCYDCRKAWASFTTNSKTFSEYTILSFRLRCWKSRWARKPDDPQIEGGVALLKQLLEMDQKLLKESEKWLTQVETEKDDYYEA